MCTNVLCTNVLTCARMCVGFRAECAPNACSLAGIMHVGTGCAPFGLVAILPTRSRSAGRTVASLSRLSDLSETEDGNSEAGVGNSVLFVGNA